MKRQTRGASSKTGTNFFVSEFSLKPGETRQSLSREKRSSKLKSSFNAFHQHIMSQEMSRGDKKKSSKGMDNTLSQLNFTSTARSKPFKLPMPQSNSKRSFVATATLEQWRREEQNIPTERPTERNDHSSPPKQAMSSLQQLEQLLNQPRRNSAAVVKEKKDKLERSAMEKFQSLRCN